MARRGRPGIGKALPLEQLIILTIAITGIGKRPEICHTEQFFISSRLDLRVDRPVDFVDQAPVVLIEVQDFQVRCDRRCNSCGLRWQKSTHPGIGRALPLSMVTPVVACRFAGGRLGHSPDSMAPPNASVVPKARAIAPFREDRVHDCLPVHGKTIARDFLSAAEADDFKFYRIGALARFTQAIRGTGETGSDRVCADFPTDPGNGPLSKPVQATPGLKTCRHGR